MNKKIWVEALITTTHSKYGKLVKGKSLEIDEADFAKQLFKKIKTPKSEKKDGEK